jgi:integrase
MLVLLELFWLVLKMGYQIKDLLGHSSVAVTQQSYAHLQQSTLRTASEVAARTLEETLRVVAG